MELPSEIQRMLDSAPGNSLVIRRATNRPNSFEVDLNVLCQFGRGFNCSTKTFTGWGLTLDEAMAHVLKVVQIMAKAFEEIEMVAV